MSHFFLPPFPYLPNNVVVVAGHSHEYSDEGPPGEVTEIFFP